MQMFRSLCLAGCLAFAAAYPSSSIVILRESQEAPRTSAAAEQGFVYLLNEKHPQVNGLIFEDDNDNDNDDDNDEDDQWEVDSDQSENKEEDSDEGDDKGVFIRNKRQSRDRAMDLALNHQDHNGNDRAVGRLHGRADLHVSGQDGRNYHAHSGVGVGSVLWRSSNSRHSFGAGAYANRDQGSYDGFKYQTRPDVGVGLGYSFKF